MSTLQTLKFETKRKNLFLRVAVGHFATTNRHTNYYIDVVSQKARLSEAKAVAEELSSYYYADTVVDTILCLDGTEVIGAFLADYLAKSDIVSMNAHKSIYVVSPEYTNSNQILFRDNIAPMIKDKNILILAVSVSSGKTVLAAIDAIRYYGGKVSGISSIFSTEKDCIDYPVHSIFDPNDLDGYSVWRPHECPLCKEGAKLDALINSHGFSKI
ncbi:MAG: orotate phosphoribosyltransferase [Clostridia bacterium]|nr:orotate phosphoribosyltransferase [Clostridia bacterium]